MKVLFVTPYYAPAWDFGGPVRAAEGLARSLVRRGHEVHVWTSDATSRCTHAPLERREEMLGGVRVRRYPTLGLRALERFNMFVTPSMGRSNGLRGFDVVHLHEFRTFQNALVVPRLSRLRIPFVMTPHGAFDRRGRVAAKQVYDAVFGKRIVRCARYITALTRLEATDIERLGVPAEQIRILPNGVVVPEALRSNAGLRGARSALGLPAAGRVVLFLGRLQAIKGPDLLLEAFAAVSSPEQDVYLVVVGPDEGMRDELVARAQALGIWDRVRFTGPLEGEAKEAAYACASVVALPSRSEGQSITLLEALARAKPVVCTEACAFEAAVQDFAEVVPAERRALADGLLRTLRGLESARGRAVAGQRFVCETYSLERVAAAAERIYFEAFGQAGP